MDNKKGFTLLEVIIAITVLFVGAVGLMTLLNYSVISSSVSVNKLIATNLAQEGIEVIRHERDGGNWDSWYSGGSGDYRVEIRTNPPYSWDIDQDSDYQLYYDNDSGLYNHDGEGDLSIFHRRVANTIVSDDERKIEARVWWSERGKDYELIIESRLHNWKP